MNRFQKACILDREEFKFPRRHPTTGAACREVWRLDNGEMVRCRMCKIRKGDIFLVRTNEGVHENAYLRATEDAVYYPVNLDWGVMYEWFQEFIGLEAS